MSTYDFDVDVALLRSTTSLKWNRFGADVLPAWVADMDFAVAPEIDRAVRLVSDSRFHGYPVYSVYTELAEVFAARCKRLWALDIDPELVVKVSEVVQCLHAASIAFSDPGDGVLILTPIYPPFLAVPVAQQRVMVEHRMEIVNGRYVFDAERLRAEVARHRPKVLFLCNPHNPVGRVFDPEELQVLADLVVEHDMVCVADEIHADLVYAPHRHIAFATLGDEVAKRTITVTSASKAFNLAGLRCAVMAFGSPKLKERFAQRIPDALLGVPSVAGLLATIAAWRDAQPWLEACLAHLEANRAYVSSTIASRLPQLGYVEPEGTYLAWLDFNACEWPSPLESVAVKLRDEAGVALNEGPTFGTSLEHFGRLNFATSRPLLSDALGRIERWVDSHARR